MGLAWISPLYLAGLLLLALPVLIHLVQRQRPSGFRFPSLMFLRQIPWREKRRLEIRHWLLLLLRCLLLALIALAFARPFFSDDNAVAPDLERSDSVIVLDRSYSMRAGDRWSQARDIAIGLVEGKSALDRIGVILFDDEAEVASDLNDNADDLRGAIARQQPGLRGTRPRVAIEQAARLLAGSSAGQRRIVLISDFLATTGEVPVIDSGIELETRAVAGAAAANAAIGKLSVEAPAGGGADEFGLAVEVVNHGDSDIRQRLVLSLDGRPLPPRELNLAPGETSTLRFDGLSAGTGLVRGVASLDSDALEVDNRAYFVYSNRQRVPVLIVEDGLARANQSLYLEQALGLSRQPLFRVKRSTWQTLEDRQLSAWAVIIVNDAPLPDGKLGEALEAFVAGGGGLLIALGDAPQGNWNSGEEGLVPGRLARRVDLPPGTAERISTLDRSHPLLAKTNDLEDLSSARIYRYRELQANPGDRVLGRYGDGGVALLERQVGDGRVMVLTTTLDAHWNDFALQPVFLPFLHRSLRYLAGYETSPVSFEIGAIVDLLRYARGQAGVDAVVAAANAETLVVEAPSDREIRLPREAALLEIGEQGFYQVHRSTPAGVDVVLAANVNRAESDPRALDVERFVGEIKASARTAPPQAVLTRRQAAGYEQRQHLWFGLLSAVLAIALLEAFCANWIAARRYSRKRIGAGRT
ncbi:MAG: BatA domain-containing protein [Gammaproteobacteria bacterium]|jgi:hypothetical protein